MSCVVNDLSPRDQSRSPKRGSLEAAAESRAHSLTAEINDFRNKICQEATSRPIYSITSSARVRKDSGMVSPIAGKEVRRHVNAEGVAADIEFVGEVPIANNSHARGCANSGGCSIRVSVTSVPP
jgi:hypothetical protein